MNSLVARRLGLEPSEERRLRAAAVARIGRSSYLLRLLAFAVATTPVLRIAVPSTLRPRVIQPLLFALMPDQADLLAYVEGGGG